MHSPCFKDVCPDGDTSGDEYDQRCTPQGDSQDDCSAFLGGDLSGNPNDGSCTCPPDKDQVSTGGSTVFLCADKCAANQKRDDVTLQCYDDCANDLSGSASDNSCDCPAGKDKVGCGTGAPDHRGRSR